MTEHPKDIYKEAIAKSLRAVPENIFLFWKGRVGLYALLKAMGVSNGDEVIMPAFTCVVVPNACIYLGAKPVFVDIDPSTMNMNVSLLGNAITGKTKIILAQNTFGLPPEIDAIMNIAKEKNISVIEDCTHGFGGTYNGKPNGTTATASFYSTQWNKPFSTGIGGFAWTNDGELGNRMSDLEQSFEKPSIKETTLLRILIAARGMIGHSPFYWTMVKAYRKLSKVSGFVGSSSDAELTGTEMPEGYLKQISDIQCSKGLEEISKVESHIVHQRQVAGQYSSFLESKGVKVRIYPPEHTFLKYPLLVTDRDKFLTLAEEENIELGDWFVSPIHPVRTNWEKWHYVKGSAPEAEFISAHMVNLPTHSGIDTKRIDRIFRFLDRYEGYLVKTW